VPEGATVLPNGNGTAPGLYLKAENRGRTPRHLFLLPGPPRELEPMFRRSVMPMLTDIAVAKAGVTCRTFRIACVGESIVEAAIGAQLLALKDVELGYCARPGEVDVRVLGPLAALDEAEKIIKGAFEKQLYTTGDENLEEVVVALLAEGQQTLAIAESCTGGYLANRVTNVAGASAVFQAGYVTYANEAKSDVLFVSAAVMQEHGAVSEVVARHMAEGARRRAGVDFALATTGIAGPDGGSQTKPLGTVFIALASAKNETTVQRSRFQTDRQSFKQLASETALELLRERLVANSLLQPASPS